jgi:hypothetical protein
MRLKAADMSPDTYFTKDGEEYVKKADFQHDGLLCNCIHLGSGIPEYVLLDEFYDLLPSLTDKEKIKLLRRELQEVLSYTQTEDARLRQQELESIRTILHRTQE